MVAAADQAGIAKNAGFTDTNAWVAKTTTVSRTDAARQVALANKLEGTTPLRRRSTPAWSLPGTPR